MWCGFSRPIVARDLQGLRDRLRTAHGGAWLIRRGGVFCDRAGAERASVRLWYLGEPDSVERALDSQNDHLDGDAVIFQADPELSYDHHLGIEISADLRELEIIRRACIESLGVIENVIANRGAREPIETDTPQQISLWLGFDYPSAVRRWTFPYIPRADECPTGRRCFKCWGCGELRDPSEFGCGFYGVLAEYVDGRVRCCDECVERLTITDDDTLIAACAAPPLVA